MTVLPTTPFQVLASFFGWWQFAPGGGTLLGLPIDVYLGWIVLWGALPAIAAPRLPMPWLVALAFGLDLLYMPRAEPLLVLGDSWLVGDAAGALIGLSAVHEFAVSGGGTPMPFDPPRRLVTSGPYAYIANPMQAAACLVLVALAVLLGCGWLAVAALIDVVYGAGIAGWHEHEYMRGRFEQPWRAPGWAFVGWTLRLPIVRPVGQVLVDASGGGPRRVSRARPAR